MTFNKLIIALLLALTSVAMASTTWYVNGASGSDSNDCKSSTSTCKTIGHAISLATSGDSIMIAAATYTENLTVDISLTLVGSGAGTTIIDGGGINTVLFISQSSANVSLSKLTIRNGYARAAGGINNHGTLTINKSIITANTAHTDCHSLICSNFGGGIANMGPLLTINNSSVIGNTASLTAYSGSCQNGCRTYGAGISACCKVVINNSTVSGNSILVSCTLGGDCSSLGGGIFNLGDTTISRSTISGNSANSGGGIGTFEAAVTLTNSTVSGNVATYLAHSAASGGGIWNSGGGVMIYSSTIAGNSANGAGGSGGGIGEIGVVTLRNSIVADNTAAIGANCNGTMLFKSQGHNLSNDLSCNFNGPGDLNNADPHLGPLQSNGGPTKTMALPSGSPAIDAGNPNGCTDGNGNLLKTDQRGKPRPDPEDSKGCDIGAYESQSD